MSRGEPGIYGDESYPFCMNEAKNTVWLHELICKNRSRCTKKPASEWPVKGWLQEGIAGDINDKSLRYRSTGWSRLGFVRQ